MSKKPEIIKSEIVATSRLFQIEQLDLRFSNGEQRIFERIQGNGQNAGSVMIVPMLDADTVLLVREYAAGVHGYELGLPKGIIEHGEEAASAANRELKEETGYGARRIQPLKPLSMAPGYFRSHLQVVLATDLYEERLPGDEPEAIEVVPWQLNRLDALLEREDFSEARSIAALFMVRELYKRGENSDD